MSGETPAVPGEFEDPEWVVFGGSPAPEPGRAAEHGAFDPFRKLFARELTDVKQDFARVSGQVEEILRGIATTAGDFELEEVKLELGFSASGKLVLVAEAGVETTVGITFRRKSGS
jgi:hypothetical protein